MRWLLVLGLSLLGCVGQLRAQPASGHPARAKVARPHRRAPAHDYAATGLAADLRAAWLAALAEPAPPDSTVATAATTATMGHAVLVAIEPLAAAGRPGFLQIQVAGLADEVTLRLLNGRGRVVRRQRSRSPLRLAVGSLGPGRYFLLATDTAGQLLADCQCIVIGL
ncbi:MAG: hypothetical protein ACRYG7_36625 [Janthinobacterium lividum]